MAKTKLQNELEKLAKDGYVRIQKHSTLPLSIYTYTQKTEIEKNWTPETLMSRGLVIDDSGRVVINCVPKFFNLGQPGAENISFDHCYITAKEDGYMIQIINDHKYGLIVTSKGSFESKYAQTALKVVLDNLTDHKLPEGVLFCCELLMDFPGDEGIIVTKHGDTPKLKCWAVRFNDGNELFPETVKLPSFLIPVESFDSISAKKYLEKTGVEGVVLCDIKTRARVKIKTQEFIERHRFISNITPKNIWERLKNGETLVDMNIPDEFLPQVKPIYEKIVSDYRQIKKDSFRLVGMTKNLTNKAVALNTSLALSKEDKHLIFFFRRNPSVDEVSEYYWSRVKPSNSEEKA